MLTQVDFVHAFRGLPAPARLTGQDRAAYLVQRRLYWGYRTGEISRDEAERVTSFVHRFDSLPQAERLVLCIYGAALLRADCASGLESARVDGVQIAGAIRDILADGQKNPPIRAE